MNDVLIIGLLILVAIQLVFVSTLLFRLIHKEKKYKLMETKFVQYLDSLDRENQRLRTGKVPEKARKNYKALLV